MTEHIVSTIRVVRGPDGVPICLNDLPPDHTARWIKKKKRLVAAAVKGGLLSREEAARRYRLSMEELSTWLDTISGNTLAGSHIPERRSY